MKRPPAPPEPVEALVYLLRPDGTALWLQERLANSLAVRRGDKLTIGKFTSDIVQLELQRRRNAESPKRKEAA